MNNSFLKVLETIRRKNDSIFAVCFPDGLEITFRLPGYKQALQYSTILSVLSDDQSAQNVIHNFIFSKYITDEVLSRFENLPAGVPETISNLILYLSGTNEDAILYTKELLKTFRGDSVNSFINIAKRTICSVFAAYKFTDIDNMNFQDIVFVFTQAEKVLIEKGIIERELEFKTAEEIEKENKSKNKSLGNRIQEDMIKIRET